MAGSLVRTSKLQRSSLSEPSLCAGSADISFGDQLWKPGSSRRYHPVG
jgi:hypothetical protein